MPFDVLTRVYYSDPRQTVTTGFLLKIAANFSRLDLSRQDLSDLIILTNVTVAFLYQQETIFRLALSGH
jgi:hypothetical protein